MMILKRILNKIGLSKNYKLLLNGVKFRVPIFGGLGFANFDLKESWMLQVLNQLSNKNSHILDVGVNVGQTLLLWKSIDISLRYTGVEPNPDCVYYLNQLIRTNNWNSTMVLPMALNDVEGISHLMVSETDKSDSSASIIQNFRTNESINRVSVPVLSMPFSILNDTSFDIVKIDVEGGELNVLKSLFINDWEKWPTIICEVLPVYSKENMDRLNRQNELELLLKNKGYSMFRIIKKPTVKLLEIPEIGIHSDLNDCDYLFIHESNKNEILSKFKS